MDLSKLSNPELTNALETLTGKERETTLKAPLLPQILREERYKFLANRIFKNR